MKTEIMLTIKKQLRNWGNFSPIKILINNFSLKELDDDEMKELLKSVTGKKSLGLDWICSYSLKIVAEDLLPELKAIINLSIRTGKFGTIWKLSKVLPGWKNKGSKSDSKFYRPISNLSEVSKLCERAIHNQLSDGKWTHSSKLLWFSEKVFYRPCSTAHSRSLATIDRQEQDQCSPSA